MNDGPGGLVRRLGSRALPVRWLPALARGHQPEHLLSPDLARAGRHRTARKIRDQHEFLRVEGREGQVLRVTADLDQLARDCKQLSPEDAGLIDKLVRAARRCASLDAPEKAMELMTIPEKMQMMRQYLPMLWTVGTWMRRPVSEYAARYHSPFLREVVMALAGHPAHVLAGAGDGVGLALPQECGLHRGRLAGVHRRALLHGTSASAASSDSMRPWLRWWSRMTGLPACGAGMEHSCPPRPWSPARMPTRPSSRCSRGVTSPGRSGTSTASARSSPGCSRSRSALISRSRTRRTASPSRFPAR